MYGVGRLSPATGGHVSTTCRKGRRCRRQERIPRLGRCLRRGRQQHRGSSCKRVNGMSRFRTRLEGVVRRQGDRMKRRDFITLLGGAATAWPLAARAQQVERVRRIGLLMGVADDREGQARVTALKQGLQDLGWTGAATSKSRRVLLALMPAAYGLTLQN